MSLRDVAERVASVGLIVVPVVVIALWLVMHHKPGWYHPAELDATGMQRARRQALSTADSISDQMVKRDPFDVVLSDESVTQWIAALGSIWPEAEAWVPPEITDIAVVFDDGVLRIAGRYSGAWQAIVSAHLTLGVTEDGSRLWVQLVRAYGGSLPLPSSMIERLLMNPQADLSNRVRTEIENRFVWFNGRRPYRILSIQIAQGELRLRIEPL